MLYKLNQQLLQLRYENEKVKSVFTALLFKSAYIMMPTTPPSYRKEKVLSTKE